MALPTLRKTFKKEILNPNSLLIIFIFSFIYYCLSVLLINFRLIQSFVFGNNLIFYKLVILKELILGAYSALGQRDFILLIISSLLVGANLLILFKTLKSLKAYGGKLSLTVGGTTVLGILVAGSCSCGFSLLSVLGIAGALSFLPFGGLEIHLFVIALLGFSFWYSLKNYHEKIVCKIK
ncbi:MAG TPA: hypothetical protein VES68_02090 [Candidatus Sulfotelmatobacter sp.]|nr:hypothetical protein [Candidatus Sulfotelmatobacter sp.]